ncbi:preprotein translocase subunit YajC [Novosphingobium profundi]|uniref:preprotein translocase subunit YajC n=1 Tax=Novosphingobium profundi TaxID=1774954 RepID=UPI001BDB0EE8|nr:preprotein translocase subunit YajC [Novosphingobium profundi]MBT0669125.1 preprotein translocase subunit YajC [Novosphingobium profundi]
MRASRYSVIAPLALALGLAGTAQAQSIDYGAMAGGSESASSPGSYSPGDEDGPRSRDPNRKKGRKLEVTPYIEVDQIVTAQLSPGNDVLTYTQAAVGVDASVTGRNTGGSISARYARQIGWSRNARDGDVISGIARGYATLTPGLTLEAGGLATQTSYSGRASNYALGDNRQSVYSVYAGPSFATRTGNVDLKANYRIGYSRLEQANAYRATADSDPVDVHDDSLVQAADLQAGVAPGVVLPVGLGVGASYNQEDISDFDQRIRDMQARAMVTVPVSRTVQVVGAIGYEDVEISNRDVLYDGDGNAVIGKDGQYVTDKSSPRQLSYDASGLIWDAAVMWRPSRRTSLSAHVGRRYGSTSFGGTLVYSPDDRKTLSVVVYDNVAGFGGQINRALYELPDDFEAVRDPVTGELTGCVNSLDGSNCLSGVLGSVRSSAFRARGIAASYVMQIGRLSAGIGAGYDRRKYIGAEGTILASANGLVDENTWLTAYLGGPLGPSAGWSTNAYVNWINSSDTINGDLTSYGLSASYYQLITPRLRGTLAVSVDGLNYDLVSVDDIWSATGLAGLRYSF